MAESIGTTQAKKLLTYVWFVGSAIPFLLVVCQSAIGDRYGVRVREVWEWLLPTLVPTSTLILGVLVWEARNTRRRSRRVSRVLFRVTLGLAVVYLLIVNGLLVFMQPVDPGAAGVGGIETLTGSGIYLAPLQGLVTAAFGAFFVSGESE